MGKFDINGKVAVITGGASGIGFQCALQLLEKFAQGVTLVDTNLDAGNKCIAEIEKKFGKSKAIFVQADVSDYDQFEGAFKQSLQTFKNVDVLINNAGIFNDGKWQREIDVNLKGTINGMLLGLENYLPKHKSGEEAVILNVSSVAATGPCATLPVYGATKFAIHGLTLSWGVPYHYERTKVRTIGLCPGITQTNLVKCSESHTFGPDYFKLALDKIGNMPKQGADQLARHVMDIIERAPTGTMWVVEGNEEPYQYKIPNRLHIPKIYLK